MKKSLLPCQYIGHFIQPLDALCNAIIATKPTNYVNPAPLMLNPITISIMLWWGALHTDATISRTMPGLARPPAQCSLPHMHDWHQMFLSRVWCQSCSSEWELQAGLPTTSQRMREEPALFWLLYLAQTGILPLNILSETSFSHWKLHRMSIIDI